jgi:hypothetical protein
MTTKNKLVWRLGKLPSVDELRELVKDKILTNDEAREILFTNEEVEERDKKSLEGEIKFLRDLVETLSNTSTKTITETIRIIQQPYVQYRWYKPYDVWCSAADNLLNTVNGTATYYASSDGSATSINYASLDVGHTGTASAGGFNSIKTF